MSANRSNKPHNDGDFDTYRQIAPELFSDESLRNLIKSKNNNRDEIVAAIENIWHDTPEKQAVGSEWVTTSKTAVKKPVAQVSRRVDNAGGRGGGRRTNQPVGGRGNGESVRVEKSSAANVLKVTPKPAAPIAVENTPPVISNPAILQEVAVQSLSSEAKPAWGSGPSFAAKLKMAETEKAKAAAALAEEEKKRAAKTEEAPTIAAVPESDEALAKRSTTPKSRVRKAKPGKKAGEDAVAAVAEESTVAAVVDQALADALHDTLVLGTVSLSVAEDSPAVIESAPLEPASGFLKIGKWEASATGSSEVGGSVSSGELFQFGSFGTSSSSFVPPAAQQQANAQDNVASSWGSVVEDSVRSSGAAQDSASGWAASSSETSSILPAAATAGGNSASAMGSLFASQQQQQQQPKTGIDGASSAGAPRPPPGLEHNSQLGIKQNQPLRSAAPGQQPQQKYNKETAQQQQQQQQLLQMQQQSMLYGQQPLQQYGQQATQLPPGISGPALSNRGGLQQAPPASTLPYTPYTPGFDLSQPPFMHAPYTSAPASTLSLPGSTATTTPALTAAAASTSGVSQSGLQTQQQQQQYAPAAPFPFYGNPYYNQAYYYGQPPQVPNFYGQQGGGRYQEQGPYGANPYGNPGSLYPPQQQPTGQFGESAATYGMGQGAVLGSNQQQQGASKSGSGAKAANASTTTAQQSVAGLQPQDLGMGGGINYGYNPYNQQQQQQQRGMDPQAWQYQQNQQAAAWAGGPIMNFGAPGAGSGLQPNQQQSFVPQATQQQQTSHLGMNLTNSGGSQQQQPQQQQVGQQRNGPPTGSAPYGSTASASPFIGGNRNSNGVGATATGSVPQGW